MGLLFCQGRLQTASLVPQVGRHPTWGLERPPAPPERTGRVWGLVGCSGWPLPLDGSVPAHPCPPDPAPSRCVVVTVRGAESRVPWD